MDDSRVAARRDYSLDGEETRRAIAAGLADGQWYEPPIDPERLRQLTARRNARPAADTALWLALVAGTGAAAFLSLGTWWAIPAFAAFGVMWGGSADSRWHENGHGTVFAASWANDAVYDLAAFMMLREPTMWRFQHARHHSQTSIVGLDPEISVKRPPRYREILLNYLLLVNGPLMVWRILQHTAGYHDAYTRELVPADKLRRVTCEARVFSLLLAGVVAASIATGSIVPLLFVGLPTFYGAWLMWFFAVTQHAGLREDVLDHRMSTRTVYINPVLRFLYLNMNYHLEHHMFPMVPYYNLPALHEEIKQWLPPPKPSLWSAYREIVHALRRQRRDASFEIDRGWTPPAEPERSEARRGVLVALPDGGSGEVDARGEDLLAPGDFGQVDIGDGTPVALPDGGRRLFAHRRRVHPRPDPPRWRPLRGLHDRVPEAQRSLRRPFRRGGAAASAAPARRPPPRGARRSFGGTSRRPVLGRPRAHRVGGGGVRSGTQLR